MAKNALGQADSIVLDIQFISNKLISRLSVYNIHLCKKTPPIHFSVSFSISNFFFLGLRIDRQNREIIAIAKASLGEIFI